MTAYKYKAISRDGAHVSGVVDAYDEFEAVAAIKETCSIVLKIEPVPVKRERIDLNEPLWVSEKVLAMVSSQFSILLRAGLPTVRTVEVIAQQTTDKLMKKILTQVARDVAAGYSMAQSFESRGKKIPLAFIETVRAGEESGTLETSFAKLEKYYDKSYKMKAKVRGAMQYPIFLLVLAVAVIAIVITVTMPTMTSIIEGAGNALPLPTAMLLGITDFFTHWWGLVAGGIIALIVVLKIYSGKSERGRTQFAVCAMRMPILGKINVMKGAAQFANTMATLLVAGLPMTRALAITGKVLDNYAIGQAVGRAVLGIEEGKRLGDILQKNPYLPPLLVEMTAVGEESGSLEDTLTTIGAYYDSEVEAASNRALAMLEPMITVIMGGVIAFIVLSLYLPMFQVYGSMGGGIY